MNTTPTPAECATTPDALKAFVYHEAMLLDTQRYDEWLSLYAEDGLYWMPPDATYETWDGQPSIFAEDKNLMTVRMLRVLHPDWTDAQVHDLMLAHGSPAPRHLRTLLGL